MTANDDFDFSINSVPTEWNEAAQTTTTESSQRTVVKDRSARALPSNEQADLFSAFVLSLACSIVSGVLWYLAETTFSQTFWWAPVFVGLLLALGGRTGGGVATPELRFGLSLAFYCVTVLFIGLVIAQTNLETPFHSPTFDEVESRFIFDRFTRLVSQVGVAGGLVVIWVISFGLAKRRRS